MKEIGAFLERNNLLIGDANAKKVLMKTFGIKERRYYYLKQKMEGHNQNIRNYLDLLKEQGYRTKYFDWDDN